MHIHTQVSRNSISSFSWFYLYFINEYYSFEFSIQKMNINLLIRIVHYNNSPIFCATVLIIDTAQIYVEEIFTKTSWMDRRWKIKLLFVETSFAH